jgi:hypothetical protein
MASLANGSFLPLELPLPSPASPTNPFSQQKSGQTGLRFIMIVFRCQLSPSALATRRAATPDTASLAGKSEQLSTKAVWRAALGVN